eukprot:2389472-Rhodomonas_salina.1
MPAASEGEPTPGGREEEEEGGREGERERSREGEEADIVTQPLADPQLEKGEAGPEVTGSVPLHLSRAYRPTRCPVLTQRKVLSSCAMYGTELHGAITLFHVWSGAAVKLNMDLVFECQRRYYYRIVLILPWCTLHWCFS